MESRAGSPSAAAGSSCKSCSTACSSAEPGVPSCSSPQCTALGQALRETKDPPQGVGLDAVVLRGYSQLWLASDTQLLLGPVPQSGFGGGTIQCSAEAAAQVVWLRKVPGRASCTLCILHPWVNCRECPGRKGQAARAGWVWQGGLNPPPPTDARLLRAARSLLLRAGPWV